MVRSALDLASTLASTSGSEVGECLVLARGQLGAHKCLGPRDGPACARSGRVLTRTIRVANDLQGTYGCPYKWTMLA